MKVKNLKKIIIGGIVVYTFTFDGHDFEKLWEGMVWKLPSEIAEREVLYVTASEKGVFHVYVTK